MRNTAQSQRVYDSDQDLSSEEEYVFFNIVFFLLINPPYVIKPSKNDIYFWRIVGI